MIDVEAITYELITTILQDADAESDWLLENQKFAQGDHWQDGNGWVGPILDSESSAYDDALTHLQRIFVPEDTWNEIVERHVGGVLGEAPLWRIVPAVVDGQKIDPSQYDDSLKERITVLTSLMADWMKERDVLKVMQDATAQLLWSKRGPLRLYIPAGLRESGTIPTGTFEDILQILYVESPSVTQATVYVDPDTKERVGIYSYTAGEEETPHVEVTFVRFPSEVKFFAKSAEAAPMTVMKITDEDDNVVGEVEIQAGGRILMHEMTRPLLMTDEMARNQKKINKAATAESANLDQAGFTSRLFLNAQMPGTWTEDSEGRQTFEPSPMYVGPGTATFLTGVVTEGKDGEEVVATPQYIRDLPGSPEPFQLTKTGTRLHMLSKAKQVYVALSESPYASGESRLRARGDYEASLTTTAGQVAIALTWLMETVMYMAAQLSSDGIALIEGLRIVAEPIIDVGTTTPFENQVHIQSYQAGLTSLQTAMRRLGILDVDGEVERILYERGIGLSPRTMMQADAQADPNGGETTTQSSGAPTGTPPESGASSPTTGV